MKETKIKRKYVKKGSIPPTEIEPKDFGRGRVKKYKHKLGYKSQIETFKGDAKTLMIDLTGYINVDSITYQEYPKDIRRISGIIKHKSYQLLSELFPTIDRTYFVCDFDTSLTCPIRIFRNSNHFSIAITFKVTEQYDVKDKSNTQLITFTDELLKDMTQRWKMSPVSPKVVRLQNEQ